MAIPEDRHVGDRRAEVGGDLPRGTITVSRSSSFELHEPVHSTDDVRRETAPVLELDHAIRGAKHARVRSHDDPRVERDAREHRCRPARPQEPPSGDQSPESASTEKAGQRRMISAAEIRLTSMPSERTTSSERSSAVPSPPAKWMTPRWSKRCSPERSSSSRQRARARTVSSLKIASPPYS